MSDPGIASRRQRGAATVSSRALPRAPAARLAAERSEGPDCGARRDGVGGGGEKTDPAAFPLGFVFQGDTSEAK